MDKATGETAGDCREEKKGDHLKQDDSKIVDIKEVKRAKGAGNVEE